MLQNFWNEPYTNGFYNRAKYFEEVHGYGGKGDSDMARFNGSNERDLLKCSGDWARLSNATIDFFYEVAAFEEVNATAGVSATARRCPRRSVVGLCRPRPFRLAEIEGRECRSPHQNRKLVCVPDRSNGRPLPYIL